MKKAKELFGDKANIAVVGELNQIHNVETYVRIKTSELSWEDKKKALDFLTFVAEKRNGDIKAQKMTDRSKQHT